VIFIIFAQDQPVSLEDVQPFAGQICFSCLVFWLCNPLFGSIAFVLAGKLNCNSNSVNDYLYGVVYIGRPIHRDVVLGLGAWLSLRTKPESLVLFLSLNVESLVLVLRFMSLNKSFIMVFGFPKVSVHCTVLSLLVRDSQYRTAC